MQWTNEAILRVAMEQSAIDMNCRAEDFTGGEHVVTLSRPHPQARRYLTLPHVCDLVSYGENIVATVSEPYRALVTEYIRRYDTAHCFETPNLHVLNDAIQKDGYRVCFMAEYFLPDVRALRALPCQAELRVLQQADFADLYTDAWSNALCSDRRELDVLGVGAYREGKLIGLAACSADCESMWQIGVDVLPGYRRQGIASALTSCLALEILDRGRVPFYCCAWSNMGSARNAVRSGFRPAWAEVTVKPAAFVDQMNHVKD